MLTLKQSMELAGTNLLNSLSPDDDYLPLWSVPIEPGMRARRKLRWPEISKRWDNQKDSSVLSAGRRSTCSREYSISGFGQRPAAVTSLLARAM